jgi:hypothetical protein
VVLTPRRRAISTWRSRVFAGSSPAMISCRNLAATAPEIVRGPSSPGSMVELMT